jgi:hypothetical protein
MRIDLKGTLDLVNASIEGTFKVSDNLKKAMLTDLDNEANNTFILVGHQCQDRAEKEWGSLTMHDANFSYV